MSDAAAMRSFVIQSPSPTLRPRAPRHKRPWPVCYHRRQMGDLRTPARPGVAAPIAAAQGDAEQARRLAEAVGLPFDPLDPLPDDPDLWAEAPLELMVRF